MGADSAEQQGPTFNPLIFWPAALLNVVAYALYFIAMHLTYVGSLQGHYLVS